MSSRSGVGFLMTVVVSLELTIQANFGRGKFITDFLEAEIRAAAAVMVVDCCCLRSAILVAFVVAAAACKTAFVKSASLDDETSLEL